MVTTRPTCPNPKCGRPLPETLDVVPLYPGSTGYGYHLACCGITCTAEYLNDATGLTLPGAEALAESGRHIYNP